MTEPVEKAKRKSKPHVDRYSQNEAFAVMVFSLAMMLLFWLDEVFGSIALQYMVGKGLLVKAILVFIPLGFFRLLYRWDYITNRQSWVFGLVFMMVMLVLLPIVIIVGAFLSWLGSPLLRDSTIAWPVVISALIIVICGFWFALRTLKIALHKTVMKSIALSVFVLANLLAAGLGLYDGLDFRYRSEHMATTEDNYYIYFYRGFRRDMYDQVVLHRCNSISIDCESVYSIRGRFQEREYYPSHIGSEVLELVQGEQDNVLVLVDGEVVFDSSENRE